MNLSRLALISFVAFSLAAPPAFAQQPEGGMPGTGANYETRLSAIEESMRTLNGRVEQIEYAVKRLDLNLQRLQTDVDSRLTKLEATPVAAAPAAPSVSPPTLAPAPAAPTPSASTSPTPVAPATTTTTTTPAAAATTTAAGDASVNGTLGAIKMQDGKVTGGVNNPRSPALPNAPADYGLNTQEQYDRAFGLLRQANYDEAEKAFKAFIEKNPQDKLTDNAKYWYGETLYVRGRFEEAAVAFGEAYQQNPKGTKAPDSLLKLAMSLEALNKNADACTTLDSLKSQYPDASASVRSRATEERTKLKCSAAH